MKLSPFAFFLALLPVIAPAADLFPRSVYCVNATSGTADTNQLIAQVFQQSHLIGHDLEIAYQIQPLHHAIQALQPTQICASAITLSKDIYMHYEDLFVFSVVGADKSSHLIPFMLQTGTIQSHNGIGQNPWGGIPRAVLKSMAEREMADLEFQAVQSSSVVDLFTEVYGKNGNADSSTASLIPLDAKGELYLAVEMEIIPNPNPFNEAASPKGIYLKNKGGQWFAAKQYSTFQFYLELGRARLAATPTDSSLDGQTRQILNQSAE